MPPNHLMEALPRALRGHEAQGKESGTNPAVPCSMVGEAGLRLPSKAVLCLRHKAFEPQRAARRAFGWTVNPLGFR